jgi:hypothetical protein
MMFVPEYPGPNQRSSDAFFSKRIRLPCSFLDPPEDEYYKTIFYHSNSSITAMTDESNELLRSLIYEPGTPPTLHVLDQLLLPGERHYIPINDVQAAWTAIRDMQIRGAYENASVSLVA